MRQQCCQKWILIIILLFRFWIARPFAFLQEVEGIGVCIQKISCNLAYNLFSQSLVKTAKGPNNMNNYDVPLYLLKKLESKALKKDLWHLKKIDKGTNYKATSWNLAIVKVLRFEGILGCMCRTKAWKICCLIMLKLSSMRYVGKAVEFVEYLMSFHEYPRYQCPQFTDLPYFPESRITQRPLNNPAKGTKTVINNFPRHIILFIPFILLPCIWRWRL